MNFHPCKTLIIFFYVEIKVIITPVNPSNLSLPSRLHINSSSLINRTRTGVEAEVEVIKEVGEVCQDLLVVKEVVGRLHMLPMVGVE